MTATVTLIAKSAIASQDDRRARSDQVDEANTVIVTAPAPQSRDRVRDLAAEVTSITGLDLPLTRFTDPICARVLGLSPRELAPIATRLMHNARGAGLRVASQGCSPNVLVMFVRDGAAEVADVAKNRPHLLARLRPAELRRLLSERGPVRAWSASLVRGRDGEQLDTEGGSTPPSLRLLSASRMTLPVRRDTLLSVVMIDIGAVSGRKVNQIADYVSMRALAPTRPPGSQWADTILSLFEPGAARTPTAMTAFDRGYLRSFYAGSGNERAGVTIGRITEQITRRSSAVDPVRTAPGKH